MWCLLRLLLAVPHLPQLSLFWKLCRVQLKLRSQQDQDRDRWTIGIESICYNCKLLTEIELERFRLELPAKVWIVWDPNRLENMLVRYCKLCFLFILKTLLITDLYSSPTDKEYQVIQIQPYIPRYQPEKKHLTKTSSASYVQSVASALQASSNLNEIVEKIQKKPYKKFKSKCRCEKIQNCKNLQISIARCPTDYFMCCF